ncbi:MAG: AI-2E family transporter, partial [Phycisphaerales bacterium]
MSDTEQSYTRSGARLSDLATRHLWHIQPVRDLLVIAAIVLVLWLGAKLSLVTVPLLLAMLIAYLVEPIVQRVTRVSWISRQGAAVGIIICAVLLVFVPLTFGAIFAIGQGVSAVSQLSQNVLTLDDVLKGGLEEEELDRLPGRFWQGLAVQLD